MKMLLYVLFSSLIWTVFSENAYGRITNEEFKLILDFRTPLLVNVSQSVPLSPENLPIQKVALSGQVCRVEIEENEPLMSTVGSVEPKKFDCAFKRGDVFYNHEGSPLSKTDNIKVHVFYFRNNNSIIQTVVLKVLINLGAKSNILAEKKDLVVTTWKGMSQAINADVLRFKFNPEIESCTVQYDGMRKLEKHERGPWLATRRWPMIGRLVTFSKTVVNSFNDDCQQAILMGYRYMHRRSGSPDYDFVPLKIKIVDRASGRIINEERHYLRVKILNSTPNKVPKVRIFRHVNVTNFGGTLSPLPRDCITVDKDESKSGLLSVNISQIVGPLKARFINLRDPTQPVTSFTMKDLRDGLIVFQLYDYSDSQVKPFSVSIRVMDSHFGWSDEVVLMINSIMPENRKYQFFSMNLLTYTTATVLLKKHNIQAVGFVDESKVYYTFLPTDQNIGDIYIGKTSIKKTPQQITLQNIDNFQVSYRQFGTLSQSDLLQIQATYEKTETFFELPVHVVRLYDRAKNTVLKPDFTIQTTEKGSVCLTTEMLIEPAMLDYLLRDAAALAFAVKKDPKFGFLTYGSPDYSETLSPPVIAIKRFNLTDLHEGRLCYVNTQKPDVHAAQDRIAIKQIGRIDFPTRFIFIMVTPMPEDYLKAMMDRNMIFQARETAVYVLLTRTHLFYENFALNPQDIVYEVTEFPHFPEATVTSDAGRFISLKSLEGNDYSGDTTLHSKIKNFKEAEISTVTTFTQKQIDDGDIVFVPPLQDVGFRDREVIMRYTVQDKFGTRDVNQTLHILVKAVDNQTPSLEIGKLEVARDEELILTREMITTFDVDTPEEKLIFQVTQLPKYGVLYDETNNRMLKGHRFSAGNLGKIRYQNSGVNTKFDSFKMTISDGERTSPEYLIPLTITKRVLEQGKWKLYVNNTVLVKENASVTLHQSIFPTAPKKNKNPTYTILYNPTRGEILLNNNKVYAFTLEDVAKGRVSYQSFYTEIGAKRVHDIARLWYDNLMFSLNFSITPVNSQRPFLQAGLPLQVVEGGNETINFYTLSALDADTEDSDILINVVQRPKWGVINANGETDIPSFKMSDILKKTVVYVNSKNGDGQEQTTDVFSVKAYDGKFFSKIVEIRIYIHPINDEKPIITMRNFTIRLGESKFLTPKYFSVKDLDVPQDNLNIRVTGYPKYGYISIYWNYGDKQIVNEKTTPIIQRYFSMMNLVYTQNISASNLTARDSYQITVHDGQHTVSQVCHIRILGENRLKPKVHTDKLKLISVNSAVITSKVLMAQDSDTGEEDLIYTVLASPRLGQIERIIAQPETPLGGRAEPVGVKILYNQNFTEEEIRRGIIRYVYMAEPKEYVRDNIRLTLTDGKFFQSPINLDIVIRLPKNGPDLEITTVPINVEIGSRVVVTTDNIIVKNVDPSIEKDLSINILHKLQCGNFVKVDKPKEALQKFAYSDLKNRKILYHATGCTNVPPRIRTRIALQFGARRKEVTLEVILRPRPKQPPVVTQCNRLDVYDGADAYITPLILNASDPDTDATHLTYTIITKSKLGEIRKDEVGVQSFTQHDINSKSIKFSSYRGSGLQSDAVILNLTDGVFKEYVRNGVRSKKPLLLEIKVQAMNNGELKLIKKAPTTLELLGEFAGYTITPENLRVPFPQAVYKVTDGPSVSFIYNKKLKRFVQTFTQEDINKLLIFFMLDKIKSTKTETDEFTFIVQMPQQKLNLPAERFQVAWSRLKFVRRQYKLCPRPGILRITVLRIGVTDTPADITFGVQSKEAIEGKDFRVITQKKLFFLQDEKSKNISVNILTEGRVSNVKRFYVYLMNPSGTILGEPRNITVKIKTRRKCDDREFFEDTPIGSIKQPTDSNPTPSRTKKNRSMDQDGGNVQSMEEESVKKPLSIGGHAPIWQIPDLPSSDELKRRYEDYLTKKKEIEETKRDEIVCEKDWSLFGKRCFQWFGKPKTWNQAKSICKSNGAFLATISNKQQLHWMKSAFRVKSPFWIGLHIRDRYDNWQWHNGEVIHFLAWDRGFPKMRRIHKSKRLCVLSTRRLQWRNRPCNRRTARFVCMKNPIVSGPQ